MKNSQSVAILTYHSLDESGSVLSTPPGVFAEQMRILKESDVKVVHLWEVRDTLEGTAPSKPLVAITFDDGMMSVYEHGFRILQRYGFPATIFLVTDYCGKMNDWPSQPRWVKRQPLLGWTEVREMSTAGVIFGSHTRTHPDLRTLPHDQIEEELFDSKKSIEDALGRDVNLFAYPDGVNNETIRTISQRFFSLCCSTKLGFVSRGSDPFALERLDMYYLRHSFIFRSIFSKRTNLYIRSRRIIRGLRGQLLTSIQG